jgi:hypothetical protein
LLLLLLLLLLPFLLSSQGFAQGALTSDNPRAWYWAAALYALPLLHHSFTLDWFQLTMVALGAAQMQVGLSCYAYACMQMLVRLSWHAHMRMQT